VGGINGNPACRSLGDLQALTSLAKHFHKYCKEVTAGELCRTAEKNSAARL